MILIRFLILIGLHHAFKGKKNRNEYKGAVGFEKIKNGEITIPSYVDFTDDAQFRDLVNSVSINN